MSVSLGGRSGRHPGVVARTVEILEALGCSGRPVTLSELVRATSIPKSSMHRILSMLLPTQAVTRDGERYRLGANFTDVIRYQQRGGHTHLRRAVLPHLVDLHRRSGQVASLAVLDGAEVVFLDSIYSHHHRSQLQGMPYRAPARRTAAGQLLLALRPSEEDAVEQRRIRRDRIAITTGDYVENMAGMAAAITGRRGEAVAALTVGGHAADMSFHRLGSTLRQAAYAASMAVRGLSSDN